MKFLCLHGAYGSAANFQVQLGPLVDHVEKSGVNSRFKWINGFHNATPPPGFEDYFGAPPLHRFIDYDGVGQLDTLISKIRQFPEGLSAEETMRRLTASQNMFTPDAVHLALDKLFEIIDNDPEIEGILGYSEGATTAATLILEERRRWEEKGIPRRIKCAIFFAGWPPVRLAGNSVECILADESDDYIDIPTCHIVGCNDPYIKGAMALYSVCDENTAVLFDHGKGHTVPRDTRTLSELVSAIDQTMTMAH